VPGKHLKTHSTSYGRASARSRAPGVPRRPGFGSGHKPACGGAAEGMHGCSIRPLFIPAVFKQSAFMAPVSSSHGSSVAAAASAHAGGDRSVAASAVPPSQGYSVHASPGGASAGLQSLSQRKAGSNGSGAGAAVPGRGFLRGGADAARIGSAVARDVEGQPVRQHVLPHRGCRRGRLGACGRRLERCRQCGAACLGRAFGLGMGGKPGRQRRRSGGSVGCGAELGHGQWGRFGPCGRRPKRCRQFSAACLGRACGRGIGGKPARRRHEKKQNIGMGSLYRGCFVLRGLAACWT